MTEVTTTGADLSRLRELNSLSIVRALRDHPPSTVTELSRRTGLSRPAVDVIAQGLVTDGWASVLEPGASTPPARHEGEQALIALEGSGKLLLADGPQRFQAPCTLVVPAGAEHYIKPLTEPCINLDVFAPPREDYADIAAKLTDVLAQ